MGSNEEPTKDFYESNAILSDIFPLKLHKMLSEAKNNGNADIVSWNENGRSFTIHQPELFSSTVMRTYFANQTKYKSFQRQMNLYRFVRTGRTLSTTCEYISILCFASLRYLSGLLISS